METLRVAQTLRELLTTTQVENLPPENHEQILQLLQPRLAAAGLTMKAWELLEKARKGGLLDDAYQPKCSILLLSLLASAIRSQCSKGEKPSWSSFEEFWGVKNLRTYVYKAQDQANYATLENEINNILNISHLLKM